MHKKKGLLLIFLFTIISVILISYSLLIENREKQYDDYLFSVSIKTGNEDRIIYPFQKGSDYYFFLPSYAQKTEAYIIKNKNHNITLDNIELFSSNNLYDFKDNISYTILDNGKDVGNLFIMYGSEIPTIYIETESGNIDRIKGNPDLQEPASILVVDDGKIDYKNSIEYITGRGNFSWNFDKKGWGIKLLEDAPLLGMKSYDKWILTSNIFDDTMGLRNYIAYDMATNIGMKETSDLRFVDVYINKMYQGTYILFERIGESKDKLDIGDLDLLNDKSNKTIELNKLKPIQEFNIDPDFPDVSYREFNSPKDISGGYILERNIITKIHRKENIFTTANEETFVVRYPTFANKEELDYIKDVVEAVDRAFHAEDYVDPVTHKSLNELIDMDSFVLKYLVDEVTKNEGAGATSAYYYKKQGDDKLYAGPIWDYDKSLGRYYEWAHPDGIANAMLYKYGTPSDWYERLYYNEEAKELIVKYYKERIKPYIVSLNEGIIDEQTDKIRYSFEMNKIVWEDTFHRSDYELPYDLYEHIGDLDYSVNYLKWWINEREKFLDEEWEVKDEH